MSLRSRKVVAGRTTSAYRALGFMNWSCATTKSRASNALAVLRAFGCCPMGLPPTRYIAPAIGSARWLVAAQDAVRPAVDRNRPLERIRGDGQLGAAAGAVSAVDAC